MPVNIFILFCTQVDIKFVHKCKVDMVWSLTYKLRYSLLNNKNKSHFVIILYFRFLNTVYTCSDISHFFNLSLQPSVCSK